MPEMIIYRIEEFIDNELKLRDPTLVPSSTGLIIKDSFYFGPLENEFNKELVGNKEKVSALLTLIENSPEGSGIKILLRQEVVDPWVEKLLKVCKNYMDSKENYDKFFELIKKDYENQ